AEAVAASFPDPDVVLEHLDARSAQARDHLRVPRVVALVRPEVESTHQPRRGYLARSRGTGLEDLFDVQLDPLLRAGSLLVLARDQLADEAEREELEADDDEQDSEDQQRPLADRVPFDLEERQVAEDNEAEESERHPEAAEEVQRAVAIPADERHGQQVEEAAEVPLDPVARPPVLSRPVVDRQLGDAVTAIVGEHRDEAVELAVQ